MNKHKKSIQAIILTALVGLIVPQLFSLSNIEIFNKIAWKAILAGVFGLATFFVGFLYSIGIIKKRSVGGKVRIGTYLLMVLLLCALVPVLSLILSVVSEVVKGIILFAISTLVLVVIIKIIRTISKALKSNRVNENVQNKKASHTSNEQFLLPPVAETPQFSNNNIITTGSNIVVENQKESIDTLIEYEDGLKTISELWEDKNPNDKCITITNDENPDLKWVKIYKPRYGDGYFYGYIKMENARETVNGKIYFGDRPIWYIA